MDDFPFLNASAQLTAEEELPTFRMYDFDFEANDFKRDNDGNLILLEGNAALAVWLVKMLKTPRFTYLAYSDRYGFEIYDYIGRVTKSGVAISEMRRLITESIMTNSYVKAVTSIDFNHARRGNKLSISITLTTIYGEMVI